MSPSHARLLRPLTSRRSAAPASMAIMAMALTVSAAVPEIATAEPRETSSRETSTAAPASKSDAKSDKKRSRSWFGPRPPSIPARSDIANNAKEARRQVLNAGNAEDYVAAGYSETWNACSNYFDTLIMIQNRTAYEGDIVSAAGTAASSMVALRKNAAAAAKSLARIAAGTSFVTTVLSSYQDRALMTPYPSETKSLILAALQAYEKAAPPNSATSSSQAAMLVERHAELCTYSGITRFAKQALSVAELETDVRAPDSVLTRADQIDASAMKMAMGLSAAPLSDAQLALLYSYIVLKMPPHGEKKADDLFAQLPSYIDALGRDPKDDKKRIDPDTVPRFKNAGEYLKRIYARNEDFKALADKTAARFKPTTGTESATGPVSANVVGNNATTNETAKVLPPETPESSSNWSGPSVRVRR
jgi:hypothetical protein